MTDKFMDKLGGMVSTENGRQGRWKTMVLGPRGPDGWPTRHDVFIPTDTSQWEKEMLEQTQRMNAMEKGIIPPDIPSVRSRPVHGVTLEIGDGMSKAKPELA